MKAINLTKNKILAENLECADTVLVRMRGLLGMESMPVGYGLWIRPCKGIHTFFMKFPIDVIFLDKDEVVLAIGKKLRANRMTRVFFRASSVIELPAGTIESTMTDIGDRLKID